MNEIKFIIAILVGVLLAQLLMVLFVLFTEFVKDFIDKRKPKKPYKSISCKITNGVSVDCKKL